MTRWNPHFGNCHTFNYDIPAKHYSFKAGRDHGMIIVAYAQQEEYLHCSSISAGFRFQIHSPGVHPFPESLGFFVPPGKILSISVAKVNHY
ncbi:MAG: amiloride-sensitive sodium channel family protein, partial [Desulfobacterales bacterium]|nr:amiloride-sensitive sodium channel family protein [Desulfobacterales bacterium]